MFIWIGCNIDSEAKLIKDKAMFIENKYPYSFLNYTLPMHVSLRISFEIDNNLKDKVVKTLTRYLKWYRPFKIKTDKIELNNSICWIKMKDNKTLIKLHKKICDLLKKKYNVPYYEYDNSFIFHSTLFIDKDVDIVRKSYEEIKDFEIPKEFTIRKFLIGESFDGDFNTYRITKEVEI